MLPTIFRADSSDYFVSIAKELDKVSFEGFVVKNYEELYLTENLFIDKKLFWTTICIPLMMFQRVLFLSTE